MIVTLETSDDVASGADFGASDWQRLRWESTKGALKLGQSDVITEHNYTWYDLVHQLLHPYVAPVLRFDDRLWKTLEPFWAQLGNGNIEFQKRLRKWMKASFQDDFARIAPVETVKGQPPEPGFGHALGCFSMVNHEGHGPADGATLPLREERVLLECVFRLALGDTLFMGHQAVRATEVFADGADCSVGFALMRHSLYWMEHRRLLDPSYLPDVKLIAGIIHSGRGMKALHRDFADDRARSNREASTISRPIKYTRMYTEPYILAQAPDYYYYNGEGYRLQVTQLSQLDTTDAKEILEQMNVVLDQRGSLYREALLLSSPDLRLPAGLKVDIEVNDGSGRPTIRREREIFVGTLQRDGQSVHAAAILCDTTGVFTNVSGILDTVRPFSLQSRTTDGPPLKQELRSQVVSTLIQRACTWFKYEVSQPKQFFSVVQDTKDDSGLVDCKDMRNRALGYSDIVLDEVGAGFHWAIRRQEVAEWLSFIEDQSRKRAMSPEGEK